MFEIEDAKFPVGWHEGGLAPSNSPIKKEEGDESWVEKHEARGSQRSSVGRPLLRAAEKVQSYKEAPLNTKMRRFEWIDSNLYHVITFHIVRSRARASQVLRNTKVLMTMEYLVWWVNFKQMIMPTYERCRFHNIDLHGWEIIQFLLFRYFILTSQVGSDQVRCLRLHYMAQNPYSGNLQMRK